MQTEHNWGRLVDLGDDMLGNYRMAQPYLARALDADPGGQLVRATNLGPSIIHQAQVGLETVSAQFVHLGNNAFRIVDGWVNR